MPTFDNLESLSSVRAKINDSILNLENLSNTSVGRAVAAADEAELYAAQAQQSASQVDLGALDTAVTTSTTNANTATTQAGIATTQAGIATTQAGIATTAANSAQVNKITWRGPWVTGTSYILRDAVSRNGSSYIVKSAHTAGASTEPGSGASWTTVWDVMALQGAVGPAGPAGSGSGDVIGPASAVNNRIAVFNGTTGKLIADGGVAIDGLATAAQGTLATTALQPGAVIPWNNVSGKPTTFTPSAHTHTASEITDFATAVAATPSVTANTAKVSNATHTGDVTGSTALTIANDVVTNAKLANVATATIKGRVTAATGDPEDLTATQVRTLLNVANGATANSTDAALRDRATHTGTQSVATITGLATVATSASASDLTTGTLPAARFTDVSHGNRGGGLLHTEATTTEAGFMSASDKDKLNGVSVGATANASDAALRDRSTHTGTQAAATITGLAAVATSGSATDLTTGTLPVGRFTDISHGARAGGTLHANATTAVAGFMSSADKTKLDGVATGATANATDAQLRDRATHTGDLNNTPIGTTIRAAGNFTAGDFNSGVTTTNLRSGIPADFWAGSTSYFSIGNLGSLSTQGGNQVHLTANGYRNNTGTWTTFSAAGQTGAAQVIAGPDGTIRFTTEADKPTGSPQTVTERMRVTATGNVGINTISPTNLLDVNGTIRAVGDATVGNLLTEGSVRARIGGAIPTGNIDTLAFTGDFIGYGGGHVSATAGTNPFPGLNGFFSLSSAKLAANTDLAFMTQLVISGTTPPVIRTRSKLLTGNAWSEWVTISDQVSYKTRAEAVAATIPSYTQYLTVGELVYRRDATGTALSTNAGTVNWSPEGTPCIQHWAENTVPGTTPMNAAFLAAITWLSAKFVTTDRLPTKQILSGRGERIAINAPIVCSAAKFVKIVDATFVCVAGTWTYWDTVTFDARGRPAWPTNSAMFNFLPSGANKSQGIQFQNCGFAGNQIAPGFVNFNDTQDQCGVIDCMGHGMRNYGVLSQEKGGDLRIINNRMCQYYFGETGFDQAANRTAYILDIRTTDCHVEGNTVYHGKVPLYCTGGAQQIIRNHPWNSALALGQPGRDTELCAYFDVNGGVISGNYFDGGAVVWRQRIYDAADRQGITFADNYFLTVGDGTPPVVRPNVLQIVAGAPNQLCEGATFTGNTFKYDLVAAAPVVDVVWLSDGSNNFASEHLRRMEIANNVSSRSGGRVLGLNDSSNWERSYRPVPTNGHFSKRPDGIMEQWFYLTTTTTGDDVTWTFPQAFAIENPNVSALANGTTPVITTYTNLGLTSVRIRATDLAGNRVAAFVQVRALGWWK